MLDMEQEKRDKGKLLAASTCCVLVTVSQAACQHGLLFGTFRLGLFSLGSVQRRVTGEDGATVNWLFFVFRNTFTCLAKYCHIIPVKCSALQSAVCTGVKISQ